MIGRTLANYRVVSHLGAGGMGVVYKAVDLRLDRSVALKVLPPDKTGDPERRARFLQEARSASALNDPHIITIYDIFTEEGTDVLVMELVQGRTLKDLIVDGPVRIADAVNMALQVAEGVGAAHAAGIVHRDLKPGNIMVTERGRVKVLDFGLAKLTRPVDDQLTMSGPHSVEGALLGTVDYMSPEQARGETVDHRSDIFSFGCVLYELLTGERPFQASHAIGVMHEIMFGVITPPRARRPEVGADIDAIVLRALERDITRRYQSMEALASDLRMAQRQLTDPGTRSAAAVQPFSVPPLTVPAAAPTTAASASAAAVIALAGSVADWAKSTPRAPRHPRPRRSPLIALPIVAAVLFSVPSTRVWLLDQIAKLSSGNVSQTADTPAAPTTPYEMTQQGLALFRRFDRPGNLDSAIRLFDSAIASDTTFAPAHAAIAQAYVKQAELTGDKSWTARAVDSAKEAVRLDALLADAHVALGQALIASGDHRAAETSLRQALTLDPRNGPAWFRIGEIASAEDRRADANSAYRKAFELMPDDWRSVAAIGTVAYRSGQYDAAIEWYSRAVKIAPDVAAPYISLAGAFGMKGDYAAAAAPLQKAISIQPTAGAYTNLGTALFMDGHYRESIAAFEKGVELRPANPLMWGNLADAYRWTPGEKSRAADAYTRAIQLLEQQLEAKPDNIQNRSRLALNLAKSGEPARAVKELDAIAELQNRDVNTIYRAAVTREVAGDRGQALRWLGAALEKGYSMHDVATDPELSGLRGDVRYQRLASRFEKAAGSTPAAASTR
jgi:serine/threonine-protein kinase